MPGGIKLESPGADRTCLHTNGARLALKRNAAVGMKGHSAQPHPRPAAGRRNQGIGGTRHGAGNVGARNAWDSLDVKERGPGRKSPIRTNELDRRRRAGRCAESASCAGSEETDLGLGTRRPHISLLYDPVFCGTCHVVQCAAERLLEEQSPITVAGNFHRMTGENETTRRLKPKLLSRCAKAHCASDTKSGKSSRDVQVVPPIRWVMRRPAPASAIQRLDVGR